jgi:hypothetical protein
VVALIKIHFSERREKIIIKPKVTETGLELIYFEKLVNHLTASSP